MQPTNIVISLIFPQTVGSLYTESLHSLFPKRTLNTRARQAWNILLPEDMSYQMKISVLRVGYLSMNSQGEPSGLQNNTGYWPFSWLPTIIAQQKTTAEDSTLWSQAQRNWAGTDVKTSSLLAGFHSVSRCHADRWGEKLSVAISSVALRMLHYWPARQDVSTDVA